MYILLRVEVDRRAVCKINIKIIFGIPTLYLDEYYKSLYKRNIHTLCAYRTDVRGPTFFSRRTRIQDL